MDRILFWGLLLSRDPIVSVIFMGPPGFLKNLRSCSTPSVVLWNRTLLCASCRFIHSLEAARARCFAEDRKQGRRNSKFAIQGSETASWHPSKPGPCGHYSPFRIRE